MNNPYQVPVRYSPSIDHYPPGEEWREEALCREVDPDLWFPEKGESSKAAQRICNMCTAQQQCLQYAMDNHENFGVFGGLTEWGRRNLRRAARTA